MAIAKETPRETQLWKLLAFIGRYGHQDILKLRRELPVSDLIQLANAIGHLLKEESSKVSTSED